MDYKAIIENIIEYAGSKLTEWESNFIDSVYNQKYNYTEKQKEIIIKINRKYVCKR